MPAQRAHWRPPPIPTTREQGSLRGGEAGQGRSERDQEVPPRLPGLLVLPQPALIRRYWSRQTWLQAAPAQSSRRRSDCHGPPCRTSSAVFKPRKNGLTGPDPPPPPPPSPGVLARGPGSSALTKMAAAPQRSPSPRWGQPRTWPRSGGGAQRQPAHARLRSGRGPWAGGERGSAWPGR